MQFKSSYPTHTKMLTHVTGELFLECSGGPWGIAGVWGQHGGDTLILITMIFIYIFLYTRLFPCKITTLFCQKVLQIEYIYTELPPTFYLVKPMTFPILSSLNLPAKRKRKKKANVWRLSLKGLSIWTLKKVSSSEKSDEVLSTHIVTS